MAAHYDTRIFAARPYKPKDKSQAEGAVLLVQRWILFTLRHRKFTSLNELNEAISELLEKFNNRPFQKLSGCRRSAFEALDQPALKPLPNTRYEYTKFMKVRAGLDYHIIVGEQRYSVPHALCGKELEARISSDIVEVLFKGRRVASHPRSSLEGNILTDPAHMPSNHKHLAYWNDNDALEWASSVGQNVNEFMQSALADSIRKEEKYRIDSGLKKLALEYGNDRLESACKRAIGIGASALRNVRSILQTNLDILAESSTQQSEANFDHDNVRGSEYYH